MQDEPQAALITGLFGTGKSSVAIEMADVLEQRGLPYAVIDLDWLCWGWAGGAEGSEHRMMLANLAPVMTNYLGAGVRYLILARSIRTPAELASLRSALSMPLRIVELTVAFSEIERRLAPDITAAPAGTTSVTRKRGSRPAKVSVSATARSRTIGRFGRSRPRSSAGSPGPRASDGEQPVHGRRSETIMLTTFVANTTSPGSRSAGTPSGPSRA